MSIHMFFHIYKVLVFFLTFKRELDEIKDSLNYFINNFIQ